MTNVERIARKLKPLMPEEVKHWLRLRETAESDMQGMLDRHIVATAYKKLGDFRNKILLSLPPEKKSKGAIKLGNVVYDKERWVFGLSSSELLQNLAIFGRSGAGKTNVAFHLLLQLSSKKIPFLFLDWKRTARHLLPRLPSDVGIYTPGRSLSPFPFNPFVVPPGMESDVYINLVVDALADAYTLGDGARRLIQQALVAIYSEGNSSPTPQDLIKRIESLPEKERVRGWKITALRALESVNFAKFSTTDKTSQEDMASRLLEHSTILELDALDQAGKKFLIPLLCLWLYHVKLASAKREKLDFVIFVEEAHHVMYRHEKRAKESVMNMLLRQCREIGIAMIVIDQHPHLTSAAALGNTYTSICLNQKDPVDVSKAAALSLVDNEDKRYFSTLPVGHGIIKLQDRWREPFLVKFPLVEINKGFVTDVVLKRMLTGRQERESVRREHARSLRLNQSRNSEGRYLSEDEFLFLHDVLKHTKDGVKARYKRLGFSGERGNNIKEQLVNRGWLRENIIKRGKTRQNHLSIPGKDKRDTIECTASDRASLQHEYWKRYWAAKLEDDGYSVEMEAPCSGGYADILATKGNERIAVEVETGKSDIVANVKRALVGKVDRVIVVATDEAALRVVEKRLGVAGLLVTRRILVAVRN